MAKRTKKPNTNKWQANADDAIKLAALRWFACTIEAEAIQIYATSPSKYPKIEAAMMACVKEIHGLLPTTGLSDDDCPPGYVRCGNECAPMCMSETLE